MDIINSYRSYEEPRTANRQATPIKSIQSWKTRKSPAQDEIIARLNNVQETRTASFDKTLMGYAPQKIPTTQNKEAFQIGDVIDVVNPLHHLPVVGTVYRSFTKDQLHPVSGIIGGALYGGPVGAIAGTANAISKVQTGKDIGEHALNIVKPSQPPAETKKIVMTKELAGSDITTPNTYQDDVTTLTLAAMPPRQL